MWITFFSSNCLEKPAVLVSHGTYPSVMTRSAAFATSLTPGVLTSPFHTPTNVSSVSSTMPLPMFVEKNGTLSFLTTCWASLMAPNRCTSASTTTVGCLASAIALVMALIAFSCAFSSTCGARSIFLSSKLLSTNSALRSNGKKMYTGPLLITHSRSTRSISLGAFSMSQSSAAANRNPSLALLYTW